MILDPQPIWLDAVEGVLNRVDVRVVGKATSVEMALSLIADLKPDLLVMDVVTPSEDDRGGYRFLQLAQECAPGIRCIVLSTASEPEDIRAALAAGAVAYVVKSAHPDDLASAVRQTFDHSVYLAQGRLPLPVPRVANDKATREAGELTNREREILCLVAEGCSNAQLAQMLWVTEQTVKFHLSNVYRKLNVANRTEAARWARLHGLLLESREAV